MEKTESISNLLHIHGLKKTTIRTEMLELFMDNNFALSANDIISNIKASHDRVTIYRALASFEEHGILHRASEDIQGIKYALCGESCPNEIHTHKHVHFVCEKCHQTFCLEDVKVPEVKIDAGYSVKQTYYTVTGICRNCKGN